MKVEQSVGRFDAECWTEGAPLFIALKVSGWGGIEDGAELRLKINDLHDLRYLCDRMIAKLPADRC